MEPGMIMEMPQEYKAARLPRPLRIDGNWDKPFWKKIEPLVIDRHMGDAPVHRPRTLARLAWDDQALYIIFRVEDRYVRAVAKNYHDPVCRDSCVEFFFTPGLDLGVSYFNLEINCGGTLLFRWNPEGKAPVPVAARDCDLIQIGRTLPKIIDPEIEDPMNWSIEFRLPFAVVEKYCPDARKPENDILWKANFYKCADGSSHPHWLTWSFVDHPTPRFHMPKSFGFLRF
jgi:hypothetical protein